MSGAKMRPSVLLVLYLLAAGPAASQQTAVEGGQTPGTTDQVAPADKPQAMSGGEVDFRTIIGSKPIEFEFRPDQQITPAVESFHRTGENPYSSDQAAIAEGKKIYAKLCASCHLPNGTGRIGPSLADDAWNHPRLDTEVGRFEIIYAGGAGAMQAFGRRIDQDEILKVMAYIDTFRG
jgi:cytochrome c-L